MKNQPVRKGLTKRMMMDDIIPEILNRHQLRFTQQWILDCLSERRRVTIERNGQTIELQVPKWFTCYDTGRRVGSGGALFLYDPDTVESEVLKAYAEGPPQKIKVTDINLDTLERFNP